jgi:hypothetical protein
MSMLTGTTNVDPSATPVFDRTAINRVEFAPYRATIIIGPATALTLDDREGLLHEIPQIWPDAVDMEFVQADNCDTITFGVNDRFTAADRDAICTRVGVTYRGTVSATARRLRDVNHVHEATIVMMITDDGAFARATNAQIERIEGVLLACINDTTLTFSLADPSDDLDANLVAERVAKAFDLYMANSVKVVDPNPVYQLVPSKAYQPSGATTK